MKLDVNRLEEMANMDIRSADPKSLKEISEVKIDRTLPVKKRVGKLLQQVENPYMYLDHGMVVKISFSKNGKSLQDCMEDYLGSEFLS